MRLIKKLFLGIIFFNWKTNTSISIQLMFCSLLIFTALGCFAQIDTIVKNSSNKQIRLKLIYHDDFKKGGGNWIGEFEQKESSNFKVNNGLLDINSSLGATVWFKNKLTGKIIISYQVQLVYKGGKHDRVSDLNAFWMASNPNNNNLFLQDGKFSSYDNLHLYYAGVGGHDNTFTRFRKYEGGAGKEVLKEYTDPQHLLIGNNLYHIKIVCNNGTIQYFLNDILFWEFKDQKPYNLGYFGFRTTNSHHQISSFKVYRIQ